MDDDRAEQLLNALDERTVVQKRLQSELANGFMCLARERYRDSLATHRLAHVASETREMESRIRISLTEEGIPNQGEHRDERITSEGDDDDDDDDADNKEVASTAFGTVVSMQKMSPNESGKEISLGDEKQPIRGGIRRRRGKREEKQGGNTLQDGTSSLSSLAGENKDGNAGKNMGRNTTGVVNMFVGMPSAEIREATDCFARAVNDAIELASMSSRVNIFM